MNAVPDFTSVKGIVWDLDDTLYRQDELIKHAFNVAIARAAV